MHRANEKASFTSSFLHEFINSTNSISTAVVLILRQYGKFIICLQRAGSQMECKRT